MAQQQAPAPLTTYTGPSDPYGDPKSMFPGRYVVDARIRDVHAAELFPLGPEGPVVPAVRLIVECSRTGHVARTTVEGPAQRWAIHPDFHGFTADARAITAALQAAGVPAEVTSTGHNLYAASVRLTTPDGPRWLVVGLDGDALVWQLDDEEGSEDYGVWGTADPADAPEQVLRWLEERNAETVPPRAR
ncbi:hypothetical protein ABT095_15230 [Kitasatospora sp. NPDC002227]|uniref:hypothetical protein n=1 Tax=Kitasatospora sp. NPDC002227 TaxID=3154773 RepID=UPI00332EB5D2